MSIWNFIRLIDFRQRKNLVTRTGGGGRERESPVIIGKWSEADVGENEGVGLSLVSDGAITRSRVCLEEI